MSEGRNTFDEYIEAFHILKKFTKKGLNEGFVLDAEHDVIYAHVSCGAIPEVEAKRLMELGWHQDSKFDCWACFT
jgi:hypothetical protein